MGVALGSLGDALYKKKQEIAKVEQKVKELSAEKTEIESQLLAAMQEAGTDIVRGKTATVSISKTIRPQIQDFDKFSVFVLRKKLLHLFERRVSAKAYQEVKASLRGGAAVPGIGEYEQTRLNVTKVK